MLSFQVKFVHRQMDGQTDRETMIKQYAPDLLIGEYKKGGMDP